MITGTLEYDGDIATIYTSSFYADVHDVSAFVGFIDVPTLEAERFWLTTGMSRVYTYYCLTDLMVRLSALENAWFEFQLAEANASLLGETEAEYQQHIDGLRTL